MRPSRNVATIQETCDVVNDGGGVAEEKVKHKQEGQGQLSSKKGESVSNMLPLRKNHQT